MHRSLIDAYLCCPVDRSYPLEVKAGDWRGDELLDGELVCKQCGARFAVRDGIPDLRPPAGAEQREVAEAKAREAKARDGDAAVYDGTVSSYHTRIELSALLEGLSVRGGDTVLDLGAGTGRLTLELAARGATVIATDISSVSLQRNREKCAGFRSGSVHHVVVDACYLPIRDGVVDRAGSGMMLEHIPTPAERARCLASVRQALKPHGTLALTVYNYSLAKRLRRPREGFHGRDLYFYQFDTAEMRRLLASYDVVTLTGLLNLPFGLESSLADRVVAALPWLSGLMGELLLAVARRPSA